MIYTVTIPIQNGDGQYSLCRARLARCCISNCEYSKIYDLLFSLSEREDGAHIKMMTTHSSLFFELWVVPSGTLRYG